MTEIKALLFHLSELYRNPSPANAGVLAQQISKVMGDGLNGIQQGAVAAALLARVQLLSPEERDQRYQEINAAYNTLCSVQEQ